MDDKEKKNLLALIEYYQRENANLQQQVINLVIGKGYIKF